MNETYVHDGVEVILTGRQATKSKGTRTVTLVEIKPADPLAGTFKKWVHPTDLYMIEADRSN